MVSVGLFVVMPLLIWVGPGWLLSRWAVPQTSVLERAALALLAGIVTVAPTTYLITVVGGIPTTPLLILAVTAGWSVVGALLSRRRSVVSETTPLLAGQDGRVLLGVALGIAVLTSFSTTPIATRSADVWWHCPHLSSLYLMEDGSGPGVVAWDPEWEREVRHVFQHPTESGYGLGPALQIQRPGNAAFLVQPMAFLSTGGLVVAMFCADFLILAFALLLLARHLRSVVLMTVIAGAFLLGARALAGYQVNENTIALALSMGVLHLLLRARDPAPRMALVALAAVAFGHLVGVRPVALLLAPACLLLLPGGTPRVRWLFVGVVGLAALPWLTAHGLAFGNPLEHPALRYGHEAQVLFAGTPLEWHFTFHPLNYPFADQLMRSHHHPFPTMIRLPLEQLQAFGAPFCALVLLGLVPLWRAGGWRKVVAVGLWLVPIQLLLMAIVSLDYQKMSYVLITLAPLPWLVGLALGTFDGSLRVRGAWAAGVVLLLIGAPLAVQSLQLPVDHRSHGDFLRDRRDDASEMEKRRWLTQASLAPYVVEDLDLFDEGDGWSLAAHATVARAEAGPIEAGPAVFWAALPPAELDHEVAIRAHPDVFVPPGFLGSGNSLGVGISSGRTLFLIRVPDGAQTVRLGLRRDGASHRASVTVQDGGGTTGAERFVTALVVDRSQSVAGSPTIQLGGKDTSTHTMVYWTLRGEAWVPQPRVVSNVAWGLQWDDDAFVLEPVPSARARSPIEGDVLCESVEHRLLRTCRDDSCYWGLTTNEGTLVGVRPIGRGHSPTIVTWGTSYPGFVPEPPNSCAKQFFDSRLIRSDRAQ